MPDTASLGTVHDALSDQLPQSTSPVLDSVRQLGWSETDVGWIVAILAGTVAAVVAHAVDVEPVGARGGVDLEPDRAALVNAHIGGEALDRCAARRR